ncbi:MAG: hypothetical protein AB1411_16380 [Nitrospirota bacterium]
MALVLSGCGFATFTRLSLNDPIKPEDVAFIELGKTTFSEIQEKLGAPNEIRGIEDGAVATYYFLDLKYSRINYGWPLQLVSPVQPDLILGGGGLATDTFQVVFGPGWVARRHAFTKHVDPSRYGLWPFDLEEPHPYQLQQLAF